LIYRKTLQQKSIGLEAAGLCIAQIEGLGKTPILPVAFGVYLAGNNTKPKIDFTPLSHFKSV
jgi:hypothetical protein